MSVSFICSGWCAASAPAIQKLSPDNLPFPAYFVASTAPINVEARQADDTSDPKSSIDEISQHLQKHKGNAEILIVIHGYNTSKVCVRNWFESIQQHLAIHHSKSRPKRSILIGYHRHFMGKVATS